ncbi:MAG TPA: transposase, partial [Candidatus Bathyarchaeia archaeon]
SITIGLETGRTSLKSLCLVSYHRLKIFETPSKYRLCAISRAVNCEGMLGIDRNLNNITAADSFGKIIVNDLSKVTVIKSASRRTIARFKRNDSRIRRQIARKYGRIQTNRTQWLVHNVSKKIVRHAKTSRLNIALENIKHIRRLYRKGSGQGHYYRARLNSWPFYEVERQISYKASWEGLSVVHVSPRGTTRKCSICGDHLAFSKQSSRMLGCSSCGNLVDRDVNAARNILYKAAGLRFGPKGLSIEAVKGNPSNAMVIPGVDVSQSSPTT